MAHNQSFGQPLAFLILASFGASFSGSAMSPVYHSPDKGQSAGAPISRLAGDWRASQVVTLPGSQPSQAPFDPPFDSVRTPAPSNAGLSRMLLLLASSPAQQQALTAELSNLQNPASPEYHQWLTPAAFADSYSNSAADVSAFTAWLQSQGFQVAPFPAGRGWIEFSGTVAQVEQAFHTQVDSVATPSGSRFVLAESISIPAALAPLVQGLVSLDGALSTPALTEPQFVNLSAADLEAQSSHGHSAALTPQLAANLLQFDALHTSGITGAGETIAIAARSNVNISDIAAFQNAFGLAASAVRVLPNGDDPGLTADQAEATLAVSWAGAAAPAAQIVLVPAATTSSTDGLDLSLAAIVDQALAHTVAVGYSTCEAALTPTHQAFYASLYRQAAAEGISIVAAVGDSGPSACHLAGSSTPVSNGYGVNALASTPWNTAVGVSAFGAGGPAAGNEALMAWSPVDLGNASYASGGGRSTIYAAPTWQPIPSMSEKTPHTVESHKRLLPDLSLPTAIDSGSNPGLAFCLSAAKPASGCTLMRAGGSSGAAALFAGIAALVDQKNGQQGNLAPNLYLLSRQTGIFTDVEQGAAQLPCLLGSPDCNADGQIGFSANAGYDLATGLGVVNAHGLVTEWAKPEVTGTGLAIVTNTTAPGQTIIPSGSIVLSANIVSGTGGPAPTGTVTFQDIMLNQTVSTVALDIGTGETSTATVTVTGVLAQGEHQIVAEYSGDTNYAASTSASVSIAVARGATTTTVTASPTMLSAGATETLSATVAPENAQNGTGTITGTVSFYDNGANLLGTAAVANGGGANLSGVSLANNASHSITAIYSGDTNWLTSTSPALPLAATTLPDTVVLTSNSATLAPGQALILTATVTPNIPPFTGAEQNPTGNVVFYNGTTIIGTAPLAASPLDNYSIATLTTETLPGGQDVLGALYQGDLYYDAEPSNPLTLSIEDFTIVPSPTNPATNLNIVQGASGSASFVITGLGGFTNTLQVVCAVPSQDDVTCTATPQEITPPGTVSFVIQTFIPGEQGVQTTPSHRIPPMGSRAAGGAALAVLGFFLLPYGRRTRIFTGRAPKRIWTLLLLLAGLAAAGMGCSSVTPVNGTGTPLGVATLKITASANVDNTVVSHSVYLTVNVLASGATQ